MNSLSKVMGCLLLGHPATSVWTENGEHDVAFAHTQLAIRAYVWSIMGKGWQKRGKKILGSEPALQIVNKN